MLRVFSSLIPYKLQVGKWKNLSKFSLKLSHCWMNAVKNAYLVFLLFIPTLCTWEGDRGGGGGGGCILLNHNSPRGMKGWRDEGWGREREELLFLHYNDLKLMVNFKGFWAQQGLKAATGIIYDGWIERSRKEEGEDDEDEEPGETCTSSLSISREIFNYSRFSSIIQQRLSRFSGLNHQILRS